MDEPVIITEPGVYDIPEDVYHADCVKGGSLSYSGAKKLLAEGGPELYAYEREHPPEPSAEMELGTAAHKLVLGVGPELVVVNADSWRTNDAKKAAKEARDRGAVPLLTDQIATVHAMAARLREHKWASALLSQGGTAEASGFWTDPEYGTWWRCRWDRMPEPDPRRRPQLADYKTCASAAPGKFSKAIADFRYYLQAHVYTTGYNALFGDRIAAPADFNLIAQETKAPYRVAVYRLHPDALRKGRDDASRAMEIWHDCTEAGVWPGYDPEPQVIDLPYWSYKETY
jgi:hypothetical protein